MLKSIRKGERNWNALANTESKHQTKHTLKQSYRLLAFLAFIKEDANPDLSYCLNIYIIKIKPALLFLL